MTNQVTFGVDLTVFRKLLDIADKLGVSPNRAAKYLMLQNIMSQTQERQLAYLAEIRDSFDAAQQPKRTTPRLLE